MKPRAYQEYYAGGWPNLGSLRETMAMTVLGGRQWGGGLLALLSTNKSIKLLNIQICAGDGGEEVGRCRGV